MCTPILIGVATGLISAVQSIAGYQAQSQAASASERAYQEQRNLNQEAANRAYQQTQLKMKGQMEKASQQAEQGLGGGGSSYSPPLTGVPDYSGAFKKK
jgi:hypothetical protein